MEWVSPRQRNKPSKKYLHAADPSHETFVLGLSAGRLVADIFRNPLVNGPLHRFFRPIGLVVEVPLLLFGISGRVCSDTMKCKHKVTA